MSASVVGNRRYTDALPEPGLLDEVVHADLVHVLLGE
jgi:hypothetical protein